MGGSPWGSVWKDSESHFAPSRVIGKMLAIKARTFTKHHYTCTDGMSEDEVGDVRGPLFDKNGQH